MVTSQAFNNFKRRYFTTQERSSPLGLKSTFLSLSEHQTNPFQQGPVIIYISYGLSFHPMVLELVVVVSVVNHYFEVNRSQAIAVAARVSNVFGPGAAFNVDNLIQIGSGELNSDQRTNVSR